MSTMISSLWESYLCTLGGPVHFNTQVVAILLPVELAVHHVEQIANPDLIPGWELHESHPGRDVFIFRDPEGNDVITWRPGEVPGREQKAHWGKCSLFQRRANDGKAHWIEYSLQYLWLNLLDAVDLQTLLIQETHGLNRKNNWWKSCKYNKVLIFML